MKKYVRIIFVVVEPAAIIRSSGFLIRPLSKYLRHKIRRKGGRKGKGERRERERERLNRINPNNLLTSLNFINNKLTGGPIKRGIC